jgi:ribulose-5-phosphate 4-epimerase/fuculose-1-phosphate aldolase
MQDGLHALRADFAALHRLLVLEQLHEASWGHCSVRIPGDERVLVTPGQMHWSRIRASDVLVMAPDGRVLEGTGRPNPSAWAIHAPLLAARPDAGCIVHSHPPYATAMTLRARHRFDDRADQNAAHFFDDHAWFDDYDGVVEDGDEGVRMARALGDKRVLFLRNHGVLLVEREIGLAFTEFYCLERACRVQLLARAGGDTPLLRMSVAAANAVRAYRGEDVMLHFAAMQQVLLETGDDWRD